MKRFFTLLLLAMACCLGMNAQVQLPDDWTVSEQYQDKGRMVVYGCIKDGDGYRWVGEDYNCVAAFIDGECRGVAYPSYLNTKSVNLFTLEISGTEADNGKTVTFKFLDEGRVYTARETTSYTFGETVGQPSNGFVLNINAARYFTWKQEVVDMYVGSTLNLFDYITFDPEDAILPEGQIWDLGNSGIFLELDGNTVKALQPTPEDGYAFVYVSLPIKSMGEYYELKIRITEEPVPIESITILDQYKDGVTVDVDDWATLTKILQSCYTLNPANTNETPEWSCSSETGILRGERDGVGLVWIPAEPGEYTMTLAAENASATLKVTVVQHVTGIEMYSDSQHGSTIYTYEGVGISNLLPYTYTILPANATNKDVTFTVADNTMFDANWKPLKAGETTLTVTSVDNPSVSGTATIVVAPRYQMDVKSSTVNVDFVSDPTDITAELINNVIITPADGYNLSCKDESFISFTQGGYTGSSTKVSLHKTGTIEVTAHKSVPQTVAFNDQLSISSVRLAQTTFTVVATPAVTGIVLKEYAEEGFPGYEPGQTLSLTDWENTYYAVKAVPDGAILKPELLSASFVMNSLFDMHDPEMPDFVEVKEHKGQTCVMFYPNAVGIGQMTVNYGSNVTAVYPVKICQGFAPKEGWQWVNFYAGSVKASWFDEELVEARGQNAGELIYNDPEWGLFGGLTTLRKNTAYKMKTLEPNYSWSFIYPTEEKPAYDLPIRKTWTWLAFPYQYDQNLTKALLKYQPTEGDRVISKEGGFAEWSGLEWVGNLTTLVAGESYLYYNASGEAKSMFVQPEQALDHTPKWKTTSYAPSRSSHTYWQYDASLWADNMTIVATLEGEDDAENCSVGAFVGDECRGEGKMIGGKFFITVHGKTGETVSFRLYNEMTDTFAEVGTTLKFGQMAGSLKAPVTLDVPEATAIQGIQQSQSQKAYDLSGRQARDGQRGVFIQNGKKVIR